MGAKGPLFAELGRGQIAASFPTEMWVLTLMGPLAAVCAAMAFEHIVAKYPSSTALHGAAYRCGVFAACVGGALAVCFEASRKLIPSNENVVLLLLTEVMGSRHNHELVVYW